MNDRIPAPDIASYEASQLAEHTVFTQIVSIGD